MQIIENSKVKEKLYVEKLENGLTIMIMPKKNKKTTARQRICTKNSDGTILPLTISDRHITESITRHLDIIQASCFARRIKVARFARRYVGKTG